VLVIPSPAVFRRPRHLQDDGDEDRGQDDLEYEVPRIVAAEVRGLADGFRRCKRGQNHERGADRADELRDPVPDRLERCQAAVEEHRQRDDRVEVAARDLAECVETREEREPEAEADGDVVRGRRQERQGAAEHEDERAQQLGHVLLPLLHANLP
jgi:hypothetical protein